MKCPSCGGSSTRPITPNFVECTATLWTRVATGAHPSGIQGPPFRDISQPCGHRFHTGAASSTALPCATCGTDSIGTCSSCGSRACGDHSGLLEDRRTCSSCMPLARNRRQADEQARAQAQAKANADRADAEHAQLVAHNTRGRDQARLRARHDAIWPQRSADPVKRVGGIIGTVAVLLVVPCIFLVGFLNGSINNSTGATGADFGLGLLLALAIPSIFVVPRNLAQKAARGRALRVQKELREISAGLGCGQQNCR